MIPGMYVVHQGHTYQVHDMRGTVNSHAVKGSTIYYLNPLNGEPLVFLRDPQAVDIPLTPACEVCGRAAGWNRCAASNAHPESHRVPANHPITARGGLLATAEAPGQASPDPDGRGSAGTRRDTRCPGCGSSDCRWQRLECERPVTS